MLDFYAMVPGAPDGDRARPRRLIREAARVGCRGIILDLFRVDDVFAPDVLRVSRAHRQRRHSELPRSDVPVLATLARENGLRVGLMPYDLDTAADAPRVADFLAVAAHELPWLDLVLRCAETSLPLQLGTGMAEAGEVWNAVEVALEAGCTHLTLLHAVGRYPVPPEACNLAAIGTLREMLVREFAPLYPQVTLQAGWVDYSGHPGVVARAVNHWGCDAVVIGLDTDGRGDESGAGHAWPPDRAAEIIAGGYLPVQRECDGSGRIAPQPGEMDERGWRADPADGLRPTRPVRRSWPASQPEANRTGPDVYFVISGSSRDPLARCLALAEILRDDHDADVWFMVHGGPLEMRELVRSGFNFVAAETADDVPAQIAFLNRMTGNDKPSVCVLDLDAPAGDLVEPVHDAGGVVAVIGQPDCAGADLVVVPEVGWRDDRNRDHVLGGSEFLLIGDDIVRARNGPGPSSEGAGFPRILVSFGGGDPAGLTLATTEALFDVLPRGHVQVRTPPADRESAQIAGQLGDVAEGYRIITAGDALAPLIAGADLIVTSPGQVVGEALCLGVPVLLLSADASESSAIQTLTGGGGVEFLGFSDRLEASGLADRLRKVLGDPERLSRLRFQARELAAAPIDGHGAARVADRCLELLRRRS